MKTLVVYFTRTKTTKKAAEMIAAKLDADLEEVVDSADWEGVVGYMRAGRAAMKKKTTAIGEVKYNPADYDLVVVGSPVWVGRVTPAIRAYLEKYAPTIKRAAFFTTQASAKRQRVFADMQKLSGQEPVAELPLTTKTVVKGDPSGDIAAFCKKLKS